MRYQVDLQCTDAITGEWRNVGVDYGQESIAIAAQQAREYQCGIPSRIVRKPKPEAV